MTNFDIRHDFNFNNITQSISEIIPRSVLANEPIKPEGSIFYNTTNNTIYYSNGLQWIQLVSTTSGFNICPVVIGTGASTAGGNADSIAIGCNALASGSDAIAIGSDLTGGFPTISSEANDVSIGNNSIVNSSNSVALGNTCQIGATSSGSVAVGSACLVGIASAATNSIAIGSGCSSFGGDSAMCIGRTSLANGANTISIGNQASAANTAGTSCIAIGNGAIAADDELEIRLTATNRLNTSFVVVGAPGASTAGLSVTINGVGYTIPLV